MKKLLLLSAILVGAATASQAGGIHFGFNLPLPPLPGIVIGAPAPVVAPGYYYQSPGYAYPPAYAYGGPVCEPPVVVSPYAYYGGGYYHRGYGGWDRDRDWGHRGWDRGREWGHGGYRGYGRGYEGHHGGYRRY
jgi:hypothetical protein